MTLNSKLDSFHLTFTDCCSVLNSRLDEVFTDFRDTWTILDDLRATLGSQIDQVDIDVQIGFAATFTALEACCSTLNSKLDTYNFTLNSKLDVLGDDFDATWTVLERIENGVNACCFTINSRLDEVFVDFHDTWTILDGNQLTINSRLDSLDNDVQTGFAGTFTALDACCFKVSNMLEALQAPSCVPTVIMSATTITAPGSYCLGSNITDNGITIASNNVTLDLSGRTIMIATTTGNGITVNADVANVVIQNGFVTCTADGATGSGINAAAMGIQKVTVSSVAIDGFGTGINAAFGDSLIENCKVSNSANNGIVMNQASCSKIVNCQAVDNGITSTATAAYLINDSSNIFVEESFACGNGGAGFQVQSSSFATSACVSECTAKDNNIGFYVTGTSVDVVVQKSTAVQNSFVGFSDNAAGGSRLYLANVACGNGTNYNGVTTASTANPNVATAFQNVDCSLSMP